MAAQNRAEWEAQLVREAIYFTCSTPSTAPRQRGHRLAWDVVECATLAVAYAKASANVRSIIYVVNALGDSFPLGQLEAKRYLEESNATLVRSRKRIADTR